MNGSALSSEMWGAVSRTRQRHLDRLLAVGCPVQSLARLGASQPVFGVGQIEASNGGLYQPAEAGPLAVVQPVVTWDDFGPLVVDLIAWFPTDPSRWWWRLGVGWALGEVQLDGILPVQVHARPIDWLAAGGVGVCILDWTVPAAHWSEIRTGPPLVFRDDVLRQRLRNALVQSARGPEMEISHAA